MCIRDRNSTGGNENNDKSGLGDVEVLSGCVPPVTPKGNLTISKAVAGGTDPQTFNIQLDCSDNSYDNNAITLTAGATHTVSNIPAGTTCTAVSYTHLDVYKRQMLMLAGVYWQRRRN